MSTRTVIAWTDHTLSSVGRPFASVKCHMTGIAECDSVQNIKAKGGVVGEAFQMMSPEIPALRISAMLTGETVADEHVKAPPLVQHAEALIASLGQFSVFVGMASSAARSTIADHLTNSLACFQRVRFADPITRTLLSRFTHLVAGLFAHLFALEGRHKRQATLDPCSTNLGFGLFSVGHV